MRTLSWFRQVSQEAACISDPSWPGFFWITSLLYNTDARIEGRKRARSVRMDRNGSEPAQYAWRSVIERGVNRKKPQQRTCEFYMKLGATLRTIESSQSCWNETLTGSFLQGAEVCTFVPSLYAIREAMPVMPATLRLVTACVAIPHIVANVAEDGGRAIE